jgi:hypothetical protein
MREKEENRYRKNKREEWWRIEKDTRRRHKREKGKYKWGRMERTEDGRMGGGGRGKKKKLRGL